MRELALRLLSSAIGYVGLVLLLRGPEPVRTFALYLPSSILVTLALDRGRAEIALRQGLSASARRVVAIETAIVAAIGAAVVVALPTSPLPARVNALAALAVSGALQAYVDIALRRCLFKYRRSLYVYAFQLTLSALNTLVAGAIAWGVVGAGLGLAALVALPSFTVIAFAQALRRAAVCEADDHPAEAGRELALAAIGFRAFPPAAYTAYASALSRWAPEVATAARAFYFVFGFIHVRTMARETAGASVARLAALLLALTLAMSIPLLAFASSPAAPRLGSAAVGLAATACASALFAVFLSRYRRFVHAP